MAKKNDKANPEKDQEAEASVESTDSLAPALLKGAFVGRPETKSMGARHGKLTGKESSVTPGTWETREEMFERLNSLYNIEETEHNFVDAAGDFGKDNELRKNAPRFESVKDPSKKKKSRPGPKQRARLKAQREAAEKGDQPEESVDEPAPEDAEPVEDKPDESPVVEEEKDEPASETPEASESQEDEDPKAKKKQSKKAEK